MLGAATRPPASDADTTRERILVRAEELFARQGYAGTSVREITGAAGCNLAAVNYHFGSKLGLYREVFARRLATLREQRIASIRRTMASEHGSVTIEDVLEAFADAFLEPLLDRSHGRRLVVLLGRELLDPQLEPEVFAAEMQVPVRKALSDALMTVDPALDRRRLALSIESFVAQLVHVVHLKRFTDDLGGGTGPGLDLSEMVDHIVRFTGAGIRATTEGRPS